MVGMRVRVCLSGSLLLAGMLLAGCSSRPQLAPVEDRGAGLSRQAPMAVLPAAVPGTVLPGAENAGKPGYYTVKPGDTLIRIGLENGQNWRDIVRWNSLDNPNVIEVGQVLRVVPPTAAAPPANAVAVARPVVPGNVTPNAATSTLPASAAVRPASPSAPAAAAAPASADDEVAWIWPVRGSLIAGFDEVRNKGIDLAGQAGEPVVASADGRVVYAGSGLRGYGNLIILKHNNTYLTAYAHNQALLVREDQAVRQGQKIAEMGSSDTDRVKLHFEVRRLGKPVDPIAYLPKR